MCTPIDCSKQEVQGESMWDDENTFGHNDIVTFELCHDEQEEMINEEIEVSRCKNQSVNIKDDEV